MPRTSSFCDTSSTRFFNCKPLLKTVKHVTRVIYLLISVVSVVRFTNDARFDRPTGLINIHIRDLITLSRTIHRNIIVTSLNTRGYGRAARTTRSGSLNSPTISASFCFSCHWRKIVFQWGVVILKSSQIVTQIVKAAPVSFGYTIRLHFYIYFLSERTVQSGWTFSKPDRLFYLLLFFYCSINECYDFNIRTRH